MPMFWWMRLDLVFLVDRALSGGVFWGFCELVIILGSLSANWWVCFPVFLVVLHGASSTGACWPLGGAGFSFRRRSLGELLLFDITWGQEVSGGPMF